MTSRLTISRNQEHEFQERKNTLFQKEGKIEIGSGEEIERKTQKYQIQVKSSQKVKKRNKNEALPKIQDVLQSIIGREVVTSGILMRKDSYFIPKKRDKEKGIRRGTQTTIAHPGCNFHEFVDCV